MLCADIVGETTKEDKVGMFQNMKVDLLQGMTECKVCNGVGFGSAGGIEYECGACNGWGIVEAKEYLKRGRKTKRA
jgi:DnaJ-class molecular chaperone